MNKLLHHPFHRLFQRRRSMRAWTLLLGLCYLVLSVFLPFQHTHVGNEEDDTGFAPLIIAQVSMRHNAVAQSATLRVSFLRKSALNHASKNATAHKPAFVKAAKKRSAHCLACEWQAMQVSAALPPFTMYLTDATPLRVVTTLPRYLRSRAIATSSRGPPTV